MTNTLTTTSARDPFTPPTTPGPARRARRLVTLATLGGAAALLSVACTTDLGTIGGDESVLYGINDAGTMVGSSSVATGSLPHAVRILPGGKMARLPETAGATTSAAHDVNEDGFVAGAVNDRPVVWRPDGSIVDLTSSLPLPGGAAFVDGVALGLNESETVVGYYRFSSGGAEHQAAFVWTAMSQSSVALSAPAGTDSSSAADVNDAGVVVGYTNVPGRQLPHRWTRSGASYTRADLTDLGGGAIPSAINTRGDIVGTATESGADRAVVWTAGSNSATKLAPLANAGAVHGSNADDINDNGMVVGTWADFSSPASWHHAVRWTSTTAAPQDLGVIKGQFSAAFAVNAKGTTAGISQVDTRPNGQGINHAAAWD